MQLRLPVLSLVLIATLASSSAWADVVLPSIISDHMVLQKTPKVRIWGKADPGEKVSVTLDKLTGNATAGPDGKWAVELNLGESKPGPFEMVVQGKNRIAIADVVVGEVWVASGQSNMAFCLSSALGSKEEIAASANPLLRHFLVQRVDTPGMLENCQGQWKVSDPQNSPSFTAVGYFFGKRLQKELNTPVGLINASWGGTPAEAWTSTEAIDSVPELKAAKELARKTYDDYPADKEAYVAHFGQWLQQNQREDKPCVDVAAYAGPAVAPEGWSTLAMPLAQANAKLPACGVFWFRKEITVTPEMAKQPLRVNLGQVDGFESIYWNGALLKETNYKELTGKYAYHNHNFPAEMVKEGVNVLAVRLYVPVRWVNLNFNVVLGNRPLKGEWQAKPEFEFSALDARQLAEVPQPPLNQASQAYLPTTLYGTMIHPLLPYSIKGVIWYQGEANVGHGWQYRTAFPLMINDWRSRWKQGDFPFYFCQLANYGDKTATPGDNAMAEVREAQSTALTLPNTGQAVLIDVGEVDIHPRNKQEVGNRLAAIALAKDYGKSVLYNGPSYESMAVDNGKVRLKFAHAEGGLVARPVPETHVVRSLPGDILPLVRNSPNSELEGFIVCGEDKKWVWADAKIEGDTVLVWSDKVPAPVAVRYAWAANPTCNLYNKAGFPASPFRTDNFPATSLNAK